MELESIHGVEFLMLQATGKMGIKSSSSYKDFCDLAFPPRKRPRYGVWCKYEVLFQPPTSRNPVLVVWLAQTRPGSTLLQGLLQYPA